MRWATRTGVHIDRSACAWLILRHLDPQAQFVFVSGPDEVPGDATAFDMRGVDLGHHGSDCTFETILRRYDLADPVLWRIAAIVHEADLEDDHYDAPEAAGFDLILRALALAHTDEDVLSKTTPIFDAVYGYIRRSVIAGGTPA
ncbi:MULTISPECIES: chromate resistance protein ChrB domain-containing protein [Micrococcaceae]|uniref:chromate resistance protein ChrB domain-containing protein n=1 Tax=Micrococcaceae TaxID=1268 RepID=UPI000464423C|nr:chromate resistance protein ChrB domain-containing protein [Arthrobacter sp. CAL618]